MIYGSVCSGIEAATVAWEPLGWKPAWFSEIEKFPSDILASRYETKNLGDMTKLHENEIFQQSAIDLLVGGTPCQSFSLGGKRTGVDAASGKLALEFLRIAAIKKPRWIVWENVPGVTTSYTPDKSESSVDKKQRHPQKCEGVETSDFSIFLARLQELGYSSAWGVLDAQYFGVPQQRRRLFVVAHSSGDWRYPAAIIFNKKAFNNHRSGSDSETRSLPVLTTTSAGNSNARGVVVIEKPFSIGRSGELSFRSIRDLGIRLVEEPVSEKETREQTIGRKLTPLEEEKRQGFSGNHTNVSGAADSDRYKAIGNSMAVPVMQWIGERIKFIEENTPMAKETYKDKDGVEKYVGTNHKKRTPQKPRNIIPESKTPSLLDFLNAQQKDSILRFGKCEISAEQVRLV